MAEPEDQKQGPQGAQGELPFPAAPGEAAAPAAEAAAPPAAESEAAPYNYYDDPYSDSEAGRGAEPAATTEAEAAPPAAPPPVAGGGETEPGEDDDEEGMARMSFFEHLSELRRRIFHALIGMVVAFAASLTFANSLWGFVSEPAVSALKKLGVDPPLLAQITPLEYFNIVWLKLPLLAAVFLASPWLLYQVWAFVAPGLYKKERRWAAPFVIFSAGLFILGGAFAYFVLFRFALDFLLGLGIGNNVRPMVSVDAYFSIFVNVTLGVGVVFEMPVLIFFLTLLRIITPGFLMRNVRYAILAIFLIAAIITPTPDVFNLVLFAVPMCALFFVGIGASYLLVLRREKRKFPWGKLLQFLGIVLAVLGVLMYYLHVRYGYHFVSDFPWFFRR